MEHVKNYLLTPKPWVSLAAIGFCFLVWIFVKRGFEHFLRKGKGRHSVNLRVGENIIKYMMILMAVITVLQINNVNVTSLITGLGIAGVVVGFALEDLLRDIINGANIVWDEFFSVGDVVRYHGQGAMIEGKVIDFTLKATKIRDLNTGNTVTVSNRNISEIEVLSDWVGLVLPSPYSVPADRMRSICQTMCRRIAELPDVYSCDFLGTDEFAESQISYKLLMHCDPERKTILRRKALGTIQGILAENGIDVPFNRVDVSIVNE